ncbi:ecdysteroid kinase domain-containing protein [Phthorimaea operculella]|nr:ecdysteroid kinase domain-containing protein [Phthorimaea operculella]
MAQENNKEELTAFSPIQWKLVTDVLNDKGFSDAKITENAVGEAGDNYVANVKRVVAEKNGETFKMVAKIAPRIEQLRVAMNARVLFINEHVMYNEVLPKFTELEKASGIPEEERLKYAACYGTITEEFDELILLEDLKESNYTMLDRFKSLTDGEIKLVLKNFAKLHTLSYALRHQEPETYAKYKSKLMNYSKLFEISPEQSNKFFETIEADCISILKEEKYEKGIKGTVSKLIDLDKENGEWDFNSRYSVIQQGDSWTNNIMFHLEDGKAVSCCMIDYQMSRINSPVADLTYAILNCTDHKTRKQHFIDWIDYYHSELAKCLQAFDLEAEYVYPRDQLDADLKRHGKLSVATGAMLAFVLSRESAEAKKFKADMEKFDFQDEAKMDEMMEFNNVASMSDKTQDVFRSKIEGIVDTCYEFGLL